MSSKTGVSKRVSLAKMNFSTSHWKFVVKQVRFILFATSTSCTSTYSQLEMKVSFSLNYFLIYSTRIESYKLAKL